MQAELVKLSAIKPNTSNPRTIKDAKFKKLVQSIKEFPQMLKLRPIVVDEEMVILGGNMRFAACKEAGLTEVYHSRKRMEHRGLGKLGVGPTC